MRDKQAKIIVIGAGLAGLTMAYRLQQKGYNVEVYEARGRVGGRVHSIWQKNAKGHFSVGELGGQNITDGGDAKHLRAIIKELDLAVKNYDIEFTRVFYDGHKTHDVHELLRKQNFNAKEIKAKLRQLAKTSHSMQEVLDKLFPNNSILKRILKFQLTSYEGSKPELLGPIYIKNLEYGLLGGIAPALRATGYKPLLHLATLKEGNAALPIKLSQLLHNPVQFHKVLKKVQFMYNKKIKLRFTDGETKTVDKLILALPCSVYQDIDFDSKTLPDDRLHNIKNVQYGTNAKVLIPIKSRNKEYNTVFTDDLAAFFNMDQQLLNLYFSGDIGKNLMQDLPRHYHDALKAIKTNFTLADSIEQLPQTAKDENFGWYNRPVVKSWVDDPYAKGSYSCLGLNINNVMGKTKQYQGITVKTIFEPISEQVFFIGEHTTIIEEIGTMEAAVESAERISGLF